MKVIDIQPKKQPSEGRKYIQGMFRGDRITEDSIQRAELALRHAEQFESPRKEEEFVKYIVAGMATRTSKAA